MQQYDVKCPVCGTLNKNLYLEETDGWMECDHCHQTTKAFTFKPVKKIPVYSMEQTVVVFGTAQKAAATV